jgi:hypothetical protein
MDREEEILSIFKDIARTTSQQMMDDIAVITATNGERPSFEKLMQKLKLLDKELTEKGVQLLEQQKAETGTLSEPLTNAIKAEINTTIEAFIKKL